MTDNQTGSAGVTVENGWMPIETAPKDQLILVYTPDARWRGAKGVTFGYAHSDYNGHKEVISLDGVAGPTGFRPTHWQPLPTPPEAV